jgi:YHS domain-containing protein
MQLTPLRLIIIAALVYILYRLLTGPKKRLKKSRQTGSSVSGAVQDILVEDPVCHTYIPQGQAVELHHDHQMYYFCSNKCCEIFLKQKGAEE